MRDLAKCTKCGSDQVGFEFRDWFGDDPHPPKEAYGLWFNCLKCGYSWPDNQDDVIWELT